MIQDRLKALREEMTKRGIDYYIVPTSDFHESEYVGEYFKARKWITGFTGSAGTAVIGMNEAGLWTDGRYFIQAENQLKGSGVTLFKMAQEGVPTINEYLTKNLKNGGVIGFDGRVVPDCCQDPSYLHDVPADFPPDVLLPRNRRSPPCQDRHGTRPPCSLSA